MKLYVMNETINDEEFSCYKYIETNRDGYEIYRAIKNGR